MPSKKANPTSPGRRFVVQISKAGLHKGKPYSNLLAPKPKKGGRNNRGRITTRHQGGGHKQLYRLIDFKRDKEGIIGRAERIEYDPNRTAHIALILYPDGERRYILAPNDFKVGMQVSAGPEAMIRPGNALPLRNIPVGTVLHAIELKPGKGAQLARSAGAYVQLIAREGDYATIRLRSGELRKVPVECKASIGVVSNNDHRCITLAWYSSYRSRCGNEPS